ncbi:TniQ family protein [Acidovorax sp. 22279]|uniref:TniQ family protein n=1 Tax=Acidovorax sp. 22279 TaxID=3453900 RepID=UPI003F87008F
MNLPLLAPMPHEFVLAHAGRIGFFFCGRISKSQRFRLIERAAEKHCEGAAAFSLLEQVTTIAGMNASDYARRHSLLPALRVAERDAAPALHGSTVKPEITKLVGSRLHTDRVHLCPKCVAEDLSHWGYSWFRRTHNLVGVEACPLHSEALHWVNHPDPFSLLPQHWVKLGEIKRVEYDDASEAERQFQTRLQDIYEIFLERERPFGLTSIGGFLARRLEELDQKNSLSGKNPLLSDYVLNSAPRAWLGRHLPKLGKNEPGKRLPALDRLHRFKVVPGSGFAYALALTTLFDSAEDAARSIAIRVVRHGQDDEKSAMKS